MRPFSLSGNVLTPFLRTSARSSPGTDSSSRAEWFPKFQLPPGTRTSISTRLPFWCVVMRTPPEPLMEPCQITPGPSTEVMRSTVWTAGGEFD